MQAREPRRNLWLMIGFLAVVVIGSLIVAVTTGDNELRLALRSAVLALFFGSLLGGLVKFLLDEVDRGRQERAEQAQFLLTALNDLKAVYDHTERARLLIPAHQSALTYGNEMRGLIDAKVKLVNITRAFRFAGSSTSSEEIVKRVDAMTVYLDRLISQFRKDYKPISEKQRDYEAEVKAYLAKRAADPLGAGPPPGNQAWKDICNLEGMGDFLALPDSPGADPSYQTGFLNPLDGAGEFLVKDLDEVLGRRPTKNRPRKR